MHFNVLFFHYFDVYDTCFFLSQFTEVTASLSNCQCKASDVMMSTRVLTDICTFKLLLLVATIACVHDSMHTTIIHSSSPLIAARNHIYRYNITLQAAHRQSLHGHLVYWYHYACMCVRLALCWHF
jgi:hypothetical protein